MHDTDDSIQDECTQLNQMGEHDVSVSRTSLSCRIYDEW